MTPRRSESLLQTLVRTAASAGLVLSLATTGCSKDEMTNNPPPPEPTLGKGDIQSVAPLASAPSFATPMDATPSPDASVVYFVAQDADGAGVFSLPATGGTATRLASGGLLTAPFGIVSSTDGTTLFVADSAAEEEGVEGLGRVFSVAATGGALTVLDAATGLVPRSLDLVKEDGQDVLYFTGRNPDDGSGAVWRMLANGTGLELVAKGLGDPSGVAVTKTGTVLVADSATASGAGIVEIRNGTVRELAGDMRFGAPCGIALVQDESALFVSGLNPEKGSAMVYRVELATGAVVTFDDGIAQNSDSAGLHRAHDKDVYAWADAAGETRRGLVPGGA